MSKATRECPDCSAEISAVAESCAKCGHPFPIEKSRAPIFIGIAAAVIASLAFFFLLRPKPEVPQPDEPSEHIDRAEELANEKPQRAVNGFDLALTTLSAAISPDGKTSAWADGKDVLVATIGQKDEPVRLVGHDAYVTELVFSSSGSHVISGDTEGGVNIWSLAGGELQSSLVGHDGKINDLAMSLDGKMVASGSRDGTLRLWDFWTGGQLIVIDGHGDHVNAIAFHPTRREIATAGEDHTIRRWDLETGRELDQIETGERRIVELIFSPDGQSLYSLDIDNIVHVWDPESGEQQKAIDLDVSPVAIALSVDGTKLTAALLDQTIETWDVAEAKEISREQVEHPLAFVFYEDDKATWPKTNVDFLLNMGALFLVEESMAQSRIAERTMAEIQKPDDCKIELVAAEPKLANPTSITFDDKGRLYIAESFRVDSQLTMGMEGREFWLHDDLANESIADRLAMYKKWEHETTGGMAAHSKFSERVRRIVPDESTVFADGFNSPETGTATGILAYGDDVYLGCIPNIWRLTDKDNDGRADKKVPLIQGFGIRASLAHGLHGLVIGPDGKLYFSVGDRGYHIEQDGRVFHNAGRGAILRCNLDGSDLEEFAVGFRNTQDMAFDQFGNLVTFDNNADGGDESRLIYVVKGGDYGWNMAYETIEGRTKLGPWHMDKLWQPATDGQAAFVIPPVANLSTGPSGMAFDPGVGLPDRLRNHFFLSDYAYRRDISGVRSFQLKPSGAGFELGNHEMLLSNVLATDVEFGPDGKMYLSDWVVGRGAAGIGRIYSVEFEGTPPPKPVPSAATFFTLSDDDLINMLHDSDRRTRQVAQFELAQRTNSATAVEKVAVEGENQLARIHAIWALGMMGSTSSFDKFLADKDSEIRAQAAKVIGETRAASHAERLVPLLKDDDPRVAYFAAIALGDLAHKDSIGELVELAKKNDNGDRLLRHAVVYAMYKLGSPDLLVSFTKHPSAAVRMCVLLALRRTGDKRLIKFLDDENIEVVTEAVRAIHDLPVKSELPAVAALVDRDDAQKRRSLMSRVINANYRIGGYKNAEALMQFVADPENDESFRLDAIEALSEWNSTTPRDRVLGVHRPVRKRELPQTDEIVETLAEFLQQSSGPLQQAAMKLAGNLEVASLHSTILSWISDEQKSVDARLVALRQFANIETNRDEAIRAGLESDSPVLRAEAVCLLALTEPKLALDEIEKTFARDSITERQDAFATLATIQLVDADNLLAKQLDKLLADEIPQELRADLVEAAASRDDALVIDKLDKYFGRFKDDLDQFDREMISVGGNAARGAAIFHDQKKTQCVRCHKIASQGGIVGPDLSKIATKHPREYLVDSLLSPNKAIAKGFEGIAVELADGKIRTGILKSEDDETLRLITAKGEEIEIAKSDIESRRASKSVMPADLQKRLNLLELRDLVEFLTTLK